MIPRDSRPWGDPQRKTPCVTTLAGGDPQEERPGGVAICSGTVSSLGGGPRRTGPPRWGAALRVIPNGKHPLSPRWRGVIPKSTYCCVSSVGRYHSSSPPLLSVYFAAQVCVSVSVYVRLRACTCVHLCPVYVAAQVWLTPLAPLLCHPG
jgi:hypothetical protein